MTRPSRFQMIALSPVAVVVLVVTAAIGLPAGTASLAPSTASPGPVGAVATPTPAPTATPVPTPSPSPSPSPSPTPVLVPAPLTGRAVPPEVAERYPIAVMIDDHGDARPQSGFNSASVVWQAPAEGGIPRYMLIFQENVPEAVGPVRSARQYFVSWAADWKALYVHAGGSPQALATLRAKGSGQYVYNADEFRYGGSFHRVRNRFAPHNLYTDGETLRKLARTVKAVDRPLTPAWTFAPAAPFDLRPSGGRIEVTYLANRVRYDYDRATNTYLRSVTGQSPQKDAADGQVVAPTNVVVMLVKFGPLNDGSSKHRLEADVVGSGTAWIATNGRTIKGTWRKKSITAPTTFHDAAGKPVALTVGQTFIEVIQATSALKIAESTVPTPPPTIDPFAAEY